MADAVHTGSSEWSESIGEIPAQRLAELRAIPPKAVRGVNLNVPLVVATVLAVAPKVQALRPDIHEAIRNLNFAWLDGLEDYALLLNHFHGEMLATPKPRGAASAAGEARTLRRHLKRWLLLLVDRGLIPRARCPELRGSNGHTAIATDLTVLARVLSAHCNRADPTNPVALDDLNRARVLGERMLRTGEDRNRRAMAKRAAMHLRDRAFTALMRAYEEARFAVLFVRRWEGDADRIIPPLFAVRLKRKRPSTRLEGVEDSQGAASSAARSGAPLASAVVASHRENENGTQSQLACERPIPRRDEEAGAADDREPFM
jgi:hypothetical protein